MNKKQTIRLNESQFKNLVTKIVKESVKKVLRESQNQYALEPSRKVTPEEFNQAVQNGDASVQGEYNGYFIVNWQGEWYYLNKETGMLCKPNR